MLENSGFTRPTSAVHPTSAAGPTGFTLHAESHWLVRPTGLPAIRRRCRTCPASEYRTQGRFRVNANHKTLDVWLLALCAHCGETVKLTILDRVHVRSIDPATLGGFHDNDPALAARLLADPRTAQRNNVVLDWTDAWTIHTEPATLPKADVLEVAVAFAHPIPLRTTALIAAGLHLSHSEVAKAVTTGRLTSDDKLTGRGARDFGFVFRWE